MALLAASLGGGIIVVAVFVLLFVGVALALSRRGQGIDSHPTGGHGKERDAGPDV